MSSARIVIIGTGGTISEKFDPETGSSVPALSIEDLVKFVPQLDTLAQVKVEQLINIDSSQASPADWLFLSKRVNEVLTDPDINAVVVTHGTDTMEEGVYFIDRTLQSDKAVCFVGAQRNASDPQSDGPPNIRDAVLVACDPRAAGRGAMLVMNSYILPARGARKTHTVNVQTFKADEGGYVTFGRVQFYHPPHRRQPVPMPTRLPKVDIVTMYPGSDGRLLEYAIDSGAEGIVVEALGSGNVNSANYRAIQKGLKMGIPIVIATRVYWGHVLPLYGGDGGGDTLAKAGCILSGDLTPPQARIELLLALTQTSDMNELRGYFENT